MLREEQFYQGQIWEVSDKPRGGAKGHEMVDVAGEIGARWTKRLLNTV